MPQEFYEESEAEAILRQATRDTAGAVSRQSLLAAAAELGISSEALERAESAVLTQREEKELHATFEKRMRGDFYVHLMVFGVINLFLCGLNQVVSPGYQWWLWALSGWGLGVAIHAGTVFLKSSSAYEAEFERWAEKRRNKDGEGSPVLTIKAGIVIGSKKD
jgi:hypothetical protein